MYYHAIPAPMNLKNAPAPFLVATFASGERELPTLRPAWDLGQAAELARLEAGDRSFASTRRAGGALVLSVRL